MNRDRIDIVHAEALLQNRVADRIPAGQLCCHGTGTGRHDPKCDKPAVNYSLAVARRDETGNVDPRTIFYYCDEHKR